MDLPIPHPRHCPSAEEIKSGKAEIENLERRIGGLEVRIRALQSELRDAQRKKKNCQSYIAPLRRLPVEIMIEIVHLCHHNGTNMRDMSQSCGYMRDIIIGIPRIWSEIYLLPDFRHVLPNGAVTLYIIRLILIECLCRREILVVLPNISSCCLLEPRDHP
ncbi:hypothetical protein CPB86DRAFT_57576 [Serendipita vermifera]|nr:hypothetical protein CPB86DRAFT_57576 [Serendipita vermifera]